MKSLIHRLPDHPGPDAPFWVTPILVLSSLGMGTLLLGGFLLLTACRGDEATGATEAVKVAVEAEGPASATPAASPAPFDAPAPPPPAPALNQYADVCLATPASGDGVGDYTAGCLEHLLEALRAVIGYRELPQAEVGPRLDQAQTAVRHLAVATGTEQASALARQAALDLVVLARSVAAFVDGAGDGELSAARTAAEALDPEQPLSTQVDRLGAYFRAADALVRPLVRSATPVPAES